MRINRISSFGTSIRVTAMCDRCSESSETSTRHRRRKLWEINSGLHCSVVGTCLTLSDLERIGARLKLESNGDLVDFQVHGNFVVWAGQPGPVAKQLHRLLDRRYAGAIRRLGAASDATGLLDLWKRSVEEGDIPGPYWALLTHPAADANLVIRAYGQVHMLSHLVGASNRADIRRLIKLEAERDALAEAVTSSKRRIAEHENAARKMVSEHAAEIRHLTISLSAMAGLSRRLKAAEERIRQLEGDDAYRQACAEAENARQALTRAEREAEERRTRIAHLVEQNARLADAVADLQSSLQTVAAECEATEWMLRRHLSAAAGEKGKAGDGEVVVPLAGRRIAYVGGRAGLIPHFRALVERSGGSFLHHDGGLEEQTCRLDGLLAQCDAVFCPIDCVSHDACSRAKRACKQRATPFVHLRTGSLSSFAKGLRQFSQGSAARAEAPE
jgi:hypothetical protein